MGRQFADDSATPSPISVSRDKYQNEIPSDRSSHDNTTPGLGSFNWSAEHYDTDFSSYGTSVEDKGKTPSKETMSVNVHAADRGKES